MIVIQNARRRSKRSAQIENAPSPEEIRELTAEIRKSWSVRDFCRRSNTVEHVETLQLELQPRRRGFWGD